MRAVLAAIALIVTAGLTVAHAAEQTPEQFLRGIYNAYTGDPEKAPTIRLEDAVNVRKYFEPVLGAMILVDEGKALVNQGVPTLDFDPFVNGQDFQLTGPVDIYVTDETEKSANATVSFTNAGRRNVLKYRLVKFDGQWKIYDIDWGGDGDTLRGLYITPELFLRGIYAGYTRKLTKPVSEDNIRARQLFESDLAELIIAGYRKTSDGEPVLKFDLFMGSNDDIAITGPVQVETKSRSADRAICVATFTNSGHKQVLTFSLIKVGGQWKIRDIDWNSRRSLRALLSHH